MVVAGYLDYISGYLKNAHYELELDYLDSIEFKAMSVEEKITYIRENGELIIDDFEVNDIGQITEIQIN